MKKIFAIITLALALSLSSFAQPKAIGGRFGYSGLEASYEHYVGSPNFIEADLGLDYIGAFGFKATGTYNFVFAQPSWTSRGDWAWYAGAGLSMGYVGDKVKYNVQYIDADGKTKNAKEWWWTRGFELSIPVQVGLEYTFWFPLQLSVDIRPYIGMHINNGRIAEGVPVEHNKKVGFYDEGLWGFAPTLSVRYSF